MSAHGNSCIYNCLDIDWVCHSVSGGTIHGVTGEPFLFHFKLTGVTSDYFSQLLEVSIVALYVVFSLDEHSLLGSPNHKNSLISGCG